MRIHLQLDSERNPEYGNNPAFLLRNKTNTVAYNVAVIWKTEIGATVEELTKRPRLSKLQFNVAPTRLDIIAPRDVQAANWSYYLADSKRQDIPVIAKEAEVWMQPETWIVAALYFVDKMPRKVGETSEPFIARVGIYWETA